TKIAGGHRRVTVSPFRCSSPQWTRVSASPQIANPTNTGRTRLLAHWNEFGDIPNEYFDTVIFCLPRLGSGVRIASPAPRYPHRKAAGNRGFRVFRVGEIARRGNVLNGRGYRPVTNSRNRRSVKSRCRRG